MPPAGEIQIHDEEQAFLSCLILDNLKQEKIIQNTDEELIDHYFTTHSFLTILNLPYSQHKKPGQMTGLSNSKLTYRSILQIVKKLFDLAEEAFAFRAVGMFVCLGRF